MKNKMEDGRDDSRSKGTRYGTAVDGMVRCTCQLPADTVSLRESLGNIYLALTNLPKSKRADRCVGYSSLPRTRKLLPGSSSIYLKEGTRSVKMRTPRTKKSFQPFANYTLASQNKKKDHYILEKDDVPNKIHYTYCTHSCK